MRKDLTSQTDSLQQQRLQYDPMRGARVDKADLLNVLMKTRLTLDVSLWDRTIGYYGGTA